MKLLIKMVKKKLLAKREELIQNNVSRKDIKMRGLKLFVKDNEFNFGSNVSVNRNDE